MLFEDFMHCLCFTAQTYAEYQSQSPILHPFGKFHDFENAGLDGTDGAITEMAIAIPFCLLDGSLTCKFQDMG
jgi:hypothetical protein